MTKPDLTAIAIVLDRSGSMAGIKNDAEGGLNAFVAEQRKLPGDATLMLTQFDNEYEVVFGSTPLRDVKPFTLLPRGTTALLDAIGRTITDFGQELERKPEGERPGKVLFVIVTDGYENASHEWTRERVFDLIRQQREQYAWDFVFIGADQDAIATGQALGIPAAASFDFASTGAGTRGMTQSLSNYTTGYRKTGSGSFTDADRKAAKEGTTQ